MPEPIPIEANVIEANRKLAAEKKQEAKAEGRGESRTLRPTPTMPANADDSEDNEMIDYLFKKAPLVFWYTLAAFCFLGAINQFLELALNIRGLFE